MIDWPVLCGDIQYYSIDEMVDELSRFFKLSQNDTYLFIAATAPAEGYKDLNKICNVEFGELADFGVYGALDIVEWLKQRQQVIIIDFNNSNCNSKIIEELLLIVNGKSDEIKCNQFGFINFLSKNNKTNCDLNFELELYDQIVVNYDNSNAIENVTIYKLPIVPYSLFPKFYQLEAAAPDGDRKAKCLV